MIQQASQGLNSRKEANPFDENGFLPLITAPMYSVVDETNYQTFLNNNIQVCFPRNIIVPIDTSKNNNLDMIFKNTWRSMSLNEFIKFYVENTVGNLSIQIRVCIDTANGNIPALHDAIRKAKEIHGDNLIIMTGNVASINAFVELARTGVDYIRVGIGGGGGCNTTSNTGVGQEKDLSYLIHECNKIRLRYKAAQSSDNGYRRVEWWQNIANVKIVADGISSYVKYCEKEYGFNDNGYAAINTLLYNGADLVMIGSLFAQCLESSGEKKSYSPDNIEKYIKDVILKTPLQYYNATNCNKGSTLLVRHFGMSTGEAQINYRSIERDVDGKKGLDRITLKPSEGKTVWLPVKWTLNDWLYGNDSDELPGFVNMLKSAMAYTGAKNLTVFKKK